MFDFKNASKKELMKEYKKIAAEVGDDPFFTKKELNYLPEVLMDEEQVLAFASGEMDGNSWLIVLTDTRVLLLSKGIFHGLEQTTIGIDKISFVSGSTGLLFGEITINDGHKEQKIRNVLKKTVKNFTNKLQQTIDTRKIKNDASSSIEEDPYDKLAKLASLKEKGVISENEFTAEKQKILGSS